MSGLLTLKGLDWKNEKNGPLYRALYRHIREMILSGDLRSGSRIPASRILAKEFSVSRNTVTQALDGLQADGFLISRAGSGVYVTDEIPQAILGDAVLRKTPQGKAPEISRKAKLLCEIYSERNYQHNVKPFAPGRTALEEFPFDVWARLLSRRWRMNGRSLAMQEDPMGYFPLRERVAEHLRETRGVVCSADQVMIVSGAQQGLDLIGRVLWEEGDVIVKEDPGFPGLEGVISGHGAMSSPMAIDDEGLMLDRLPNSKRIKSFLVTPSRNYPVGVTMSLSRRMALLDVACQKGSWIIEDDFDSDFRFDGRPLASLQGLDRDGRVIYVGTFSRIVFPALRLGFVILPPRLIATFKAVRAYSDGHASIVHQAALSDFMGEGYFASHLRRMRKLYHMRRDVLVKALNDQFSDYLKVMPSDGGLHLCVRFLDDVDDVFLTKQLQENGVTVRALSRFYALENKTKGMVMGFAGYDEKQMQEALAVLIKILQE